MTASVAGNYSATFTFPGDSAYNSVATVTSSNFTTVAVATPSILLGATGNATLGGSLLFTTVVTGSDGAQPPSGTLNWTISGTAGVTTCSQTTGPAISGVTATYTCTIQTPYVGSYVVQANFVGNANYASISSTQLTFTITKQAPTISVSASSNPTLGGTTTLTTTVTGLANAAAPSGAVSWSITDPQGATIVCTNPTGPVTVANVSTYTCSFTTSVAGVYHVNSTVAADSNYSAATSTTIPINLSVATQQYL